MQVEGVCVSLGFVFSSRRRHTRYWRDWSSVVCSSDLLRRDRIFLKMNFGSCSRDHDDVWRPMQQPRESELRRRNSKLCSYLSQHSTCRRQRRPVLHRIGPQWTVGQEKDSLACAEIDDRIMLAFRNAVTILN